MKINERDIELDEEGYLIHPEDWDHDVALELANSENIELSDDYWTVFDFMRNFYDDNGVAPDVRHTTKQMVSDFGVDKKVAKTKLFTMFPYGYVKQACKISGMRRPRGWSTG
ncbi:MAG TPA: TusE/DsrC/DsvC family sulfur relay protein [Candidatus Thioglobus sp.]|jgi:tRNA 2-thiouridine synthesizing protein E|nr:TusE/DsrC/DsvC family sulfur relay protein [Candidatus Thioglobus sp.]HIB97076.1 TusE/DsrC/DsvC family sulfur relay protein [Candidatus Thioglobus sp.]